MPCANGIWSVGGRNWNEDFEMLADDCNCTGHFGVDAFCLALHGADLHIRSGDWSAQHGKGTMKGLKAGKAKVTITLASVKKQVISITVQKTTVTSSGVITGKKKGTAYITVKSGKIRKKVKVVVK